MDITNPVDFVALLKPAPAEMADLAWPRCHQPVREHARRVSHALGLCDVWMSSISRKTDMDRWRAAEAIRLEVERVHALLCEAVNVETAAWDREVREMATPVRSFGGRWM